MATYRELDADSIARIGLMFIDGDALENVLLDKVGHTDYNFDQFNLCKIPLMKVERINPDLDVTAVLWQYRVDNHDFALPVVCGKALPFEGWQGTPVLPEMRKAFGGEFGAVKTRSAVCNSHYYPVYNSDHEVTGVLELIVGTKVAVDI